jgi:hypothetical protein
MTRHDDRHLSDGRCVCLGDCCNIGDYCICPDEDRGCCPGLHSPAVENYVLVPREGTSLVVDGEVIRRD